jgi:hypothetical protein
MTQRLAFAESEKVLGSQIEVGNNELLIERDDRDPEAAKYAISTRRP